MDSTVIQEIANQLGIAADQAGQFVIEQLPNYAALKVAQLGIFMAIVWALFFAFATVSVASIALCFRWSKKAKADEEKYVKKRDESGYRLPYRRFRTDIDDYMTYKVFIASGICALLFLLISIVAAIASLPDMYGWLNYPDSMLLDMAIRAIG